MPTSQIVAAYCTDQGQIRDQNEDFVILREPQDGEDEQVNGWLCIVADGVGGADAGEVASQFAAEQTLSYFLSGVAQRDWGVRLQKAIRAAHDDLCALIASRHTRRRMGTTLVAAIVTQEMAIFANVGDSRAYLCRRGRIRQITKDHSLVVKLLEEGVITEDEVEQLHISNVILQSIGSEQPPTIDLFSESLQRGDRIVLCSDGLNAHVADSEIAEILMKDAPEQAAKELVQLANLRGGQDNISIIVLQCGQL